ncbi:MAG: hypothetical protein HYX68_12630 [Planctomycetes bacterium]|nr:hypothetical protein [Planctomycetota bacterium]
MNSSTLPSLKRKQRWANALAAVTGSVFCFLLASSASARTITLTAEDADAMASISAHAPRLSWAMGPPTTAGIFNTQPALYWESKIAVLLRIPVKDLIPKGQRITKAELTIGPTYISGTANIQVRRLLADWGTGVCHTHRMTFPKKLEWTQPGGLGGATDRAAKDSAIFKITKVGDHTVDVTEDIELWYTGAVKNRGWIFTHDNNLGIVYVPSPYAPHAGGAKTWKLQITFEPK